VSGAADRIRRILSDAGPAVVRASELPPRPAAAAPTPDTPPPAANGSASRDRLRRRLEALGVGRPPSRPDGEPLAADAEPAARDDEVDDGRPLEARLGAEVRKNPKGSFLLVERRWPLEERHGKVRLADLLDHPLPLRPSERTTPSSATVDPRAAVFLDVETTGLAGGTGTVAFLVGAARVEGDAFVVRQYFMRDFPDEPALLEALARDVGKSPLVTFNGRCFDWPLLTTRLRIHRTPVADRDHLDLLPPARRLWAGSLASHGLQDLEREVLGIERTDDLPGWQIPDAYFAWLRTGRSARIARAFEHNEVDVVSMAALAVEVGRVLRDPTARPGAHPADHVGAARLLLAHGDAARARACLAAAIESGVSRPSRALRRLITGLHRRAGDLDAAMRAWRAWAEEPSDDDDDFDPHPFEELAKVHEHRRREPAVALAFVETALSRCPARDPRRAALEHRAARLRRKIETGRGRAKR
jgi:uncharacterized protein YprB with RNaseH-like and TPR domain